MTGNVSHLAVLNRISALIGPVEKPVIMFVTSTHMGQIADEVNVLDVAAPDRPRHKATPRNFREVRIGSNLIVVNSGSEDQGAVNLANQMEAERVNFQGRRDKLRTG